MEKHFATSPQIRVLVADDEENQRAGLAKMIQSWGIAVETAADGQEALEKLSQSAGARARDRSDDASHGRFRASEAAWQRRATLPPTIVLTAFGNIETAVQTMHDLGAFWFLEKPIQPSVLEGAAGARRRRKAVWRRKPNVCNASCCIKACWWTWWAPARPCSRYFR